MRRKGFTLIELVVVVAIIGILAAILLPVVSPRPHYGGNARLSSCQSNLKMIGLSFVQYAQDYHDKFPPVAVARSGYWAGSLQPYHRNWEVFQCPSAKYSALKKIDYFYNSRLARRERKSIPLPAQTILAGDGRDDSPTNAAIGDLPDGWRNAEKSPALRHLGVAAYLFADGHVKWLQPEKITVQSPAKDVFTFAIR